MLIRHRLHSMLLLVTQQPCQIWIHPNQTKTIHTFSMGNHLQLLQTITAAIIIATMQLPMTNIQICLITMAIHMHYLAVINSKLSMNKTKRIHHNSQALILLTTFLRIQVHSQLNTMAMCLTMQTMIHHHIRPTQVKTRILIVHLPVYLYHLFLNLRFALIILITTE